MLYIVPFLTVFSEILIFLAVMVCKDTGSPPSSAMALRNKPSASPVREREIHAGEDLTLLIGGIKSGLL